MADGNAGGAHRMRRSPGFSKARFAGRRQGSRERRCPFEDISEVDEHRLELCSVATSSVVPR